MPHRKRFRQALSALLLREGSDAFVIFEDTASGKFVQFAGGKEEPLLLDIPAQGLSPRELQLAARLFSELGARLEEWEVQDEPGGRTAGTHSGFQLELGKDVDKAAHVAWRVFSEVYGLPEDFDLAIEEN